MTLPKTLTTLIGSAFALAAFPAIAGASPHYDVKSVEISVSGYDLAKSGDAQILYKKIKMAAKRACRSSQSPKTLRERAITRDCEDEAIARAVSQLDEPVLTIVMSAENGAS